MLDLDKARSLRDWLADKISKLEELQRVSTEGTGGI